MGLSRYVPGFRGARRRPAEKTAFVLSGGGVLGAVQVGQLLALLESGVVPDLLTGTSVGALNGAAIAAEPSVDGVERLRSLWERVKPEDVFPGGRFSRAWRLVRKSDHLYSNQGLRKLIDELPARTFEELARPLTVVAANLRTGKEHAFSSGPLAPAVLASAALPGVFPPVLIDGQLYLDGGVVNNVPLSHAILQGATRIYVLLCGGATGMERPIRRPLDVLVQAFAHSRAVRADLDLERLAARATIHILHGVDTQFIEYNDVSQTGRLIEEARAVAVEELAAGPAITPAPA